MYKNSANKVYNRKSCDKEAVVFPRSEHIFIECYIEELQKQPIQNRSNIGWVRINISKINTEKKHIARSSLNRAIVSLKKKGVLLVKNKNASKIDRTLSYAIQIPDDLKALHPKDQELLNRVRQVLSLTKTSSDFSEKRNTNPLKPSENPIVSFETIANEPIYINKYKKTNIERGSVSFQKKGGKRYEGEGWIPFDQAEISEEAWVLWGMEEQGIDMHTMKEVFEAFISFHQSKEKPDYSKDWFVYFQGFCELNFSFQKARDKALEKPKPQQIVSMNDNTPRQEEEGRGEAFSEHRSFPQRDYVSSTQVPQDTSVHEVWGAVAQEKFSVSEICARSEVQRFIAYHTALESTYTDWDAAFLGWCKTSFTIRQDQKKKRLEQQKNECQEDGLDPEKEVLKQRLVGFGVPSQTARNILKTFDTSAIEKAMAYTQTRQEILEKNNAPLKSRAAYLMATLNKGFAKDYEIPEDEKTFADLTAEKAQATQQAFDHIENSSEGVEIQAVRKEILSLFGASTYMCWFKDAYLTQTATGVICVVASTFIRDWISTHFLPKMQEQLGKGKITVTTLDQSVLKNVV